MSRKNLAISAIAAIAGVLTLTNRRGTEAAKKSVNEEKNEKAFRHVYYTGGKASREGKRYRSQKSRSNRRKAKRAR